MQLLEVKNNIAKIIYNPADNKLLPSDFLLIEDLNQKLVGQILSVYTTEESNNNVADVRLALFIDKDEKLSYYNGYIPQKNAKVLYITADEITEMITAPNANVYLGNLTYHPKSIVKVPMSLVNEKLYIQCDRDDNTKKIVQNIVSSLYMNQRKVILLDFDGRYNRIANVPRLTITESFNFPLNIDAFNNILEYDTIDCPIEDKAVIQSIVLELRDYVKTLENKFLPFTLFKNVVISEFAANPISGLMVLRNKLWQYAQEGLFAESKADFDIINKVMQNENILIIDASKIEEKWHKFTIQTIPKILNSCCYFAFSMNDIPMDKRSIVSLYNNPNIVPIIATSYDSPHRNLLKSLSKNQILFKPSKQTEVDEQYGALIHKLNDNDFILFGEASLNLPLIIELKTFDIKTSEKIAEQEIRRNVDKILSTGKSMLPREAVISEPNRDKTCSKYIVDEDFNEEDLDFLDKVHTEDDEISLEDLKENRTNQSPKEGYDVFTPFAENEKESINDFSQAEQNIEKSDIDEKMPDIVVNYSEDDDFSEISEDIAFEENQKKQNFLEQEDIIINDEDTKSTTETISTLFEDVVNYTDEDSLKIIENGLTENSDEDVLKVDNENATENNSSELIIIDDENNDNSSSKEPEILENNQAEEFNSLSDILPLESDEDINLEENREQEIIDIDTDNEYSESLADISPMSEKEADEELLIYDEKNTQDDEEKKNLDEVLSDVNENTDLIEEKKTFDNNSSDTEKKTADEDFFKKDEEELENILSENISDIDEADIDTDNSPVNEEAFKDIDEEIDNDIQDETINEVSNSDIIEDTAFEGEIVEFEESSEKDTDDKEFQTDEDIIEISVEDSSAENNKGENEEIQENIDDSNKNNVENTENSDDLEVKKQLKELQDLREEVQKELKELKKLKRLKKLKKGAQKEIKKIKENESEKEDNKIEEKSDTTVQTTETKIEEKQEVTEDISDKKENESEKEDNKIEEKSDTTVQTTETKIEEKQEVTEDISDKKENESEKEDNKIEEKSDTTVQTTETKIEEKQEVTEEEIQNSEKEIQQEIEIIPVSEKKPNSVSTVEKNEREDENEDKDELVSIDNLIENIKLQAQNPPVQKQKSKRNTQEAKRQEYTAERKINKNIPPQLEQVHSDRVQQKKLTVYETDTSSDLINENKLNFKVGDRVYHPKHGQGTVEGFANYSNKILFCQIEFEKVGRRILDPRISGLEKIP